jgi:PAS domain S-box-containing protein
MLDSEMISPTIDRARHIVLVVDDDPATRYATSRVLRASGFRTEEAATGAAALTLARAPGVSAVVLDVHLPDIDGFEVCRLLRADASTASLPVMHVSAARVQVEDNVAGLDAGADAYLVRPVEPAVLVATLQALIRARTAEDQLRKSEARFRAIFTHAQSGIVLLDPEGHLADANPGICDMLGRSRNELLGVDISTLAPAAWEAFIRDKVCGSEAAPSAWQGEFPLTRPDGTLVHLEWSLSAHVEPGLRIGIALDASDRKQMAQRRQDLLEREQAARVSAEHHSRTKDDFIAVLSHELRTPLNAIVGWVYILNRRGGPPELLKGLEAIDRNVKTQVRIISDILDVSRITSGKLRLERELADPAKLVTSSIAALGVSVNEKQLNLTQDFSQVTAPAWLDAARFQQIFWNLLTNAVKFSRPGGEIRVFLACDGRELTLVVQDFGEGIPAEFLGHIFNRFSQSASPGNRSHGGLGLGLSIVKHLAELHGGRAEVESAGIGKGTLMRVELPVSISAEEHQAQALSQAGGSESAPHDPGQEAVLAGLEVLVVEDNAEASEMLGVVLTDRGASVRMAVDFDTAMEAVRNRRPDVLVSDVGLPGRDGYELIRQLRSAEPKEAMRMPAIALTAFTRPEDRTRALAAGFDEHLGKPLSPHTLTAAIVELLRPSR